MCHERSTRPLGFRVDIFTNYDIDNLTVLHVQDAIIGQLFSLKHLVKCHSWVNYATFDSGIFQQNSKLSSNFMA